MRPCEKLIGPDAHPCADPAQNWYWYPTCHDCIAHARAVCTGHAICNAHIDQVPVW